MSGVRAGDRFEATGDIATTGMSHWFAPFTGDFDAVIPQGTVLIAPNDAVESARGFYCRPERDEEMEALQESLYKREQEENDGEAVEQAHG